MLPQSGDHVQVPTSISAPQLQQALRQREFRVLYQPQMTVDGARMIGVEALVRWAHPQLGLLGPGHFIDFAQATGLIDELGLFVLEQACRDGKEWSGVTVSVNISPTHFIGPTFIDDVVSTLASTGFDSRRLEIEVVERTACENPDLAKTQIERLHAFGVRVSMDDFGTGYSSLSLLQKLPFDTIKIDKSFIDEIPKTRSVAILQATIALVRAIGMKVVAEGVETEAQQRFLKASGCHYLQGYLFSRPVPAEDISALLKRQSVTASSEKAIACSH